MTYAGKEVEQKMSAAELLAHAVMILCTCGLWLPVYWARKSKIKRTSKFYTA